MNEFLQVISSITPILIGIITLIIVLARMHYNLDSLSEKVKERMMRAWSIRYNPTTRGKRPLILDG